ncbi:DDX46 [Mytilus edulis]|uniref:DDX46 n=1 Tax=Mytilus edulis TaxID=6550 RepID=A0A8S3UGK3_MYTED|nr:DDX46 [Mytilus edulis]
MFSATFPRQMEALARKILQKPIEVQVGGRSVVCKDVEQHVIIIDEDRKFLKLLEILGVYQERGSVLIFVDKQEHADDLMKDLLKHSYPCMSLHGGIDQYDRDSIIQDFKTGNVKLLIATSVAARGLDVKHLILVVNFNCPNHYEDYVHRCGRTGRAGNKGFAFTFVTPEQERYSGDIIKALELSGAEIPAELNTIWETYKVRAKMDGKNIRNSGFHGRGFKFDETEAHLADERRSYRRRLSNPAAIAQQTNQQKLELAKRLAAQISKKKGPDAQDITQIAARSLMTGEGTAPLVASKTIAEQVAEKLNAKLGYKPVSEEEDQENAADMFKRYEEELKLMTSHKLLDGKSHQRFLVAAIAIALPFNFNFIGGLLEALAQICEYSEAGITVRGTYVPPKKEPPEGERKLYLAIEATSEMAIQKAKKEITRLIKEELIRLLRFVSPPKMEAAYIRYLHKQHCKFEEDQQTVNEIEEGFIEAGSFYEGTKVGQPNEFDFTVILNHLSTPGAIRIADGCSPGYKKIFVEDQLENYKKCCDRENMIHVEKIRAQFWNYLYGICQKEPITEKNLTRGLLRIKACRKRKFELEYIENGGFSEIPGTPESKEIVPRKSIQIGIDLMLGIRFPDIKQILSDDGVPEKWKDIVAKEGCNLVVKGCQSFNPCSTCWQVCLACCEMQLMKDIGKNHKICYKVLKYLLTREVRSQGLLEKINHEETVGTEWYAVLWLELWSQIVLKAAKMLAGIKYEEFQKVEEKFAYMKEYMMSLMERYATREGLHQLPIQPITMPACY